MANAPTRPRTYQAGRRPPRGPRRVPRSIHDRLAVAADLLTRIAADDLPLSEVDKGAAADSAAAVKAVAEPGGWTLLRSRNTAPADGRQQPFTLSMSPDLKNALADAAEEFGVVLSATVAEGFQRALDGEWIPPKGRSGSGAGLNVRVSADLYRRVQEALPALSEQAGHKLSRSSIAIAYLADQLGVDRAPGGSVSMMLPKPLVDHFEAAEASGASLQEILEDGIRSLLSGADMPRFRAWTRISARKRNADGTWQTPEKRVVPAQPTRLTVPVDYELVVALHELAPRLSKELGALLHPGTIARGILTDRLGEPAE